MSRARWKTRPCLVRQVVILPGLSLKARPSLSAPKCGAPAVTSASRVTAATLSISCYREPRRVRNAVGGNGADVIMDTVGGPIFEACLVSLAHKSRLVEISSPAKERRVSFDLIDFYHRESRLIGIDSRKFVAVESGSILAQLAPGFETDALR